MPGPHNTKMGCCELRGNKDTYLDSYSGLRKYNQSKNSLRPLQKRVSFVINQPGELRHSLAKRVINLEFDSEPELYSSIKQLEELLLINDWTVLYIKDWVQIKYLQDSILGSLIHFQINIASIFSVETVLNVLNNPDIRLLWDTELSHYSILDGHRLLDAKLSICKKGHQPSEVNRYVRFYGEQIALIELAGNSKMCGLVLNEADYTIVELMMPLETEDLENTLKSKKLWAARLYQEIIKEQEEY